MAWATLLFFLWGTVVLLPSGIAQAQERDSILPESGIHYPGGFDPNTVGEVQGKASGFLQATGGPIQFRLDSGKEMYIVLTSPGWYWSDLKAPISEGTEVRVRGSKSLGKDGNLYIIAQEIRIVSSGQKLVLRDDDGYPLWKGPRMGSTGSTGGFGSPQKGMGGGPGGRGRR